MPADLPIFSEELSVQRLVLGPPGTFRSLYREALWRFRWRMRHPRDRWPGFAAAWWSRQAEKLDSVGRSFVRSAEAFEGATVALEEFGASYRRHQEADRAG